MCSILLPTIFKLKIIIGTGSMFPSTAQNKTTGQSRSKFERANGIAKRSSPIGIIALNIVIKTSLIAEIIYLKIKFVKPSRFQKQPNLKLESECSKQFLNFA